MWRSVKQARKVASLVNSNLEIFRLFSDNEDFKRFVTQTSFKINYNQWGQKVQRIQGEFGI